MIAAIPSPSHGWSHMSSYTLKRVAAFAAIAFGAASVAGAQTNSFGGGAIVNADVLTGSSTNGSEMVGMNVSWTFAAGGGSFSGAWANLGGGSFGVTGANNFSLTFGGAQDTFTDSWVLTNSNTQRLQSIRLNGAPGRTLFDCGWTGTACIGNGASSSFGTSGSFLGFSLTTTGGTYGGGVRGVYSNLVGLGGNAPVGDLFEQLDISFDGIMGAGSTYLFRADTDNSSFDRPPPTITPEPSTWALMFVGLAAVGVAKRRRRSC